jgi:hypothetical protein
MAAANGGRTLVVLDDYVHILAESWFTALGVG